MAPKTTAPNKSTMAIAVGHKMIQLDAVRLAEDSGWRELDGGRVDESVAMILDGNRGATSLAGPSLVAQGGHKLISVEDSKFVICNGKHIAKALTVVRDRVRNFDAVAAGRTAPALTNAMGASEVGTTALALTEAGPAAGQDTFEACLPLAMIGGASVVPDTGSWLPDALAKVFDAGLLFSVYEFPGVYTRLRHLSVQALSHEEEQNKLYNTTLAQKARLVRSYYLQERMDWNKAQSVLTAELGLSKARTVARCVVLARDFSEPAMDKFG